MSSHADSAYNQLSTHLAAAVRTPDSVILEATALPERGLAPRPYPQYLSRIAFYNTVNTKLAIGEPSQHFQVAVRVDVNGLDIRRAQQHIKEESSDEYAIVERQPADGIRLHLIDWHRHLFTTWHLEIDPEEEQLRIASDTAPFGEASSHRPSPIEAIMGVAKGATPPETSAPDAPLTVHQELAVIKDMLDAGASAYKAAEFAEIVSDYPYYQQIDPQSQLGQLAQSNFEVLGEQILRDDLLRRWVKVTYEDATAA